MIRIKDKKSVRCWYEEQKAEGWELPAKAHRALRLPLIRWIRYIHSAIRLYRHNRRWMEEGLLPGGYDEWVLYAIFRGWC